MTKPIVVDLHDLESGARIRWTTGEPRALIFRRDKVHATPVELGDAWHPMQLTAAADKGRVADGQFGNIVGWLASKLLAAVA